MPLVSVTWFHDPLFYQTTILVDAIATLCELLRYNASQGRKSVNKIVEKILSVFLDTGLFKGQESELDRDIALSFVSRSSNDRTTPLAIKAYRASSSLDEYALSSTRNERGEMRSIEIT